MGAQQGTDLNSDTPDAVPTTGYYSDPGDGAGSKWWHYMRDVVMGGGLDDAAETDPTQDATVLQVLKGLLTNLRNSAAGILKSEDAAHASGDAGVAVLAVRRDTAAVGSGADGDYSTVNVDGSGKLWVADSAEARVGALSNARTTALAETLNVKGSAGTLFGIQGYVATDGFVQVHEDADGTLAGGAQAVEVIQVTDPTGGGDGGPFSLDFGRYGLALATGITIGFSSVGPTHTGGGSQMFVSAQYE